MFDTWTAGTWAILIVDVIAIVIVVLSRALQSDPW